MNTQESAQQKFDRVARLVSLLIDRSRDPRLGDTERCHAIFATQSQVARATRIRADIEACS